MTILFFYLLVSNAKIFFRFDFQSSTLYTIEKRTRTRDRWNFHVINWHTFHLHRIWIILFFNVKKIFGFRNTIRTKNVKFELFFSFLFSSIKNSPNCNFFCIIFVVRFSIRNSDCTRGSYLVVCTVFVHFFASTAPYATTTKKIKKK